VAEILLQRTRATQVVPVYLALRGEFPDVASLATARVQRVRAVIRPLGLAWRAGRLIELAKALRDRHGGRVPRSTARLQELPGVGPYVAAAFASFHLERRAVIVDSNVVRFVSRLHGWDYGPESHRNAVFRRAADRLTPARGVKEYNYALLDFTREVCTPRVPRCDSCALRQGCATGGRGSE
jgi:A/G-specific adenine glycosylase